jgi:hypothetical protein
MSIQKILSVDESMCLESYPCKHYIQVMLTDCTIKNVTMSSPKIYELCLEHNYHLLNSEHFSRYPSNYYSSNRTNNKFEDVLKYGTFYNPAYLHYPNSKSKQVKCDKCDKLINASIGYNNMDLCMLCVNDLTK